jgi:hypothetical protein
MSFELRELRDPASAQTIAVCVAHLRSALPLTDFLREAPCAEGATAFDLGLASRSVAVAIPLPDAWASPGLPRLSVVSDR